MKRKWTRGSNSLRWELERAAPRGAAERESTIFPFQKVGLSPSLHTGRIRSLFNSTACSSSLIQFQHTLQESSLCHSEAVAKSIYSQPWDAREKLFEGHPAAACEQGRKLVSLKNLVAHSTHAELLEYMYICECAMPLRMGTNCERRDTQTALIMHALLCTKRVAPD